MAEEANATTADSTTVDPIKNLKSEIDRKFGNFETQVSELTKTNQALLAQLQLTANQNRTQAPAAKGAKDYWYDDPDKAEAAIVERTKAEIRQEYQTQQKQTAKTNSVLNQLVYDYPELQSDSHELTKRATAIYMALDAEEKSSPIAYKLAVKEAATELSIKPRAKRSEDEVENFSMSSSRSNNPTPRQTKSGKTKLAQETIAFAKLVGLNTDDPKVMERIESRQRENWTRYR